MSKINKSEERELLIGGIALILLGIVLVILPARYILQIIYILIGLTAILISLKPLGLSLNNLKYKQNIYIFIRSLLLLLLGILMITKPHEIIIALIVIYFLVIPIIDSIQSKSPIESLKLELPKIFFGIILVFVGFEWAVDFMFTLSGIILIVLGIFCLSLRYKERYF